MARRDGTYSRLYEQVDQRLREKGQSMPISKEAFELAAEMPPGVFFVDMAAQADNYTFYQTAFLCLLCTLPEESDYPALRKYFETLSSSQFRAKTLRKVLNRCSACNRAAKVVNGEEYIDA